MKPARPARGVGRLAPGGCRHRAAVAGAARPAPGRPASSSSSSGPGAAALQGLAPALQPAGRVAGGRRRSALELCKRRAQQRGEVADRARPSSRVDRATTRAAGTGAPAVDRSAASSRPGQAPPGLEPVEPGVGAGTRRRGAQQRTSRCAAARVVDKRPAGLVGQRHALAFEQRAHAAHQQPVLARSARPALRRVRRCSEHLRGGALRFVLEVVADARRLGDSAGRGTEQRTRRHRAPGTARRRRRRACSDCDQRVGPAGLHATQAAGRSANRRVGGRRGTLRGPFERHAREPALAGARPGRRREQRARPAPSARSRSAGATAKAALRESCAVCDQRLRRRDRSAAGRCAPRPWPQRLAQQDRRSGLSRSTRHVEAELHRVRRRCGAERCGQCLRRLDARLPAAAAREGLSRHGQQLGERQQHAARPAGQAPCARGPVADWPRQRARQAVAPGRTRVQGGVALSRP